MEKRQKDEDLRTIDEIIEKLLQVKGYIIAIIRKK